MNLLLRKVTVVNGNDQLKGKTVDILVRDGIIQQIASSITAPENCEIFEAPGAHVSVGWFDMKVNFRDPGHETEEDIRTGIDAAAAGGFTGVMLMPSTHPPLQTKADIEYVIGKSKGKAVNVYPAGALSVNREGKDITEMYDMRQAGAIAFTDDKRPVNDSGLMVRALQYSGNMDALIVSYADDKSISGKGQVNEGVPAVITGMKGAPALAEELMVYRDIKISEYAGVPVHFATLSSANAVDLVRQARASGAKVSCEVTAHHLFFDEGVITTFDTNHKVKPPYRTSTDRAALIEGINDGTISVIVSDHSPEDTESKDVEFDFAAYGIIGLETAFGVARTATAGKVSLEQLVNCFSVNPRAISGVNGIEIREGEAASLTVFDPDVKWTVTEKDFRSRSRNTPFKGIELTGRPLAIINNGKLLRCQG